MRKTFAPIDDTLIERLYQPISDFVAHQLGFSRQSVSCFCLDIASFAWIVSRVPGMSSAVASWELSSAVADLAALLLGLAALASLRLLFRRAGNRQVNPLRPAMQPHRAIVLLLLAARLVQLQGPLLGLFADVVMLVCATSALYLGACAERPPVPRNLASRSVMLPSSA